MADRLAGPAVALNDGGFDFNWHHTAPLPGFPRLTSSRFTDLDQAAHVAHTAVESHSRRNRQRLTTHPRLKRKTFSGRRLRHARRLVEGSGQISHADHAGEREIVDDRQVTYVVHVHQMAHLLN